MDVTARPSASSRRRTPGVRFRTTSRLRLLHWARSQSPTSGQRNDQVIVVMRMKGLLDDINIAIRHSRVDTKPGRRDRNRSAPLIPLLCRDRNLRLVDRLLILSQSGPHKPLGNRAFDPIQFKNTTRDRFHKVIRSCSVHKALRIDSLEATSFTPVLTGIAHFCRQVSICLVPSSWS